MAWPNLSLEVGYPLVWFSGNSLSDQGATQCNECKCDLIYLYYTIDKLFQVLFLRFGYGAFHDLFWRLMKRSPRELAVSCPDVMFNIMSRDVRDEELVTFANQHEIHRIVEANGRVRWFGCRRGYPYTSSKLCYETKGLSVSPSRMENIADGIKFFMKACEDAGAFCEPVDGTLLGKDSLSVFMGQGCKLWQ